MVNKPFRYQFVQKCIVFSVPNVFSDGVQCAVDLRSIGLLFDKPRPYDIRDYPCGTSSLRHCLGLVYYLEGKTFAIPVSLDQTEIG